eukprot:1193214-Prorocentrum_minimum.AAC.1
MRPPPPPPPPPASLCDSSVRRAAYVAVCVHMWSHFPPHVVTFPSACGHISRHVEAWCPTGAQGVAVRCEGSEGGDRCGGFRHCGRRPQTCQAGTE